MKFAKIFPAAAILAILCIGIKTQTCTAQITPSIQIPSVEAFSYYAGGSGLGIDDGTPAPATYTIDVFKFDVPPAGPQTQNIHFVNYSTFFQRVYDEIESTYPPCNGNTACLDNVKTQILDIFNQSKLSVPPIDLGPYDSIEIHTNRITSQIQINHVMSNGITLPIFTVATAHPELWTLVIPEALGTTPSPGAKGYTRSESIDESDPLFPPISSTPGNKRCHLVSINGKNDQKFLSDLSNYLYDVADLFIQLHPTAPAPILHNMLYNDSSPLMLSARTITNKIAENIPIDDKVIIIGHSQGGRVTTLAEREMLGAVGNVTFPFFETYYPDSVFFSWDPIPRGGWGTGDYFFEDISFWRSVGDFIGSHAPDVFLSRYATDMLADSEAMRLSEPLAFNEFRFVRRKPNGDLLDHRERGLAYGTWDHSPLNPLYANNPQNSIFTENQKYGMILAYLEAWCVDPNADNPPPDIGIGINGVPVSERPIVPPTGGGGGTGCKDCEPFQTFEISANYPVAQEVWKCPDRPCPPSPTGLPQKCKPTGDTQGQDPTGCACKPIFSPCGNGQPDPGEQCEPGEVCNMMGIPFEGGCAMYIVRCDDKCMCPEIPIPPMSCETQGEMGSLEGLEK